jgi:hypothetical protein
MKKQPKSLALKESNLFIICKIIAISIILLTLSENSTYAMKRKRNKDDIKTLERSTKKRKVIPGAPMEENE